MTFIDLIVSLIFQVLETGDTAKILITLISVPLSLYGLVSGILSVLALLKRSASSSFVHKLRLGCESVILVPVLVSPPIISSWGRDFFSEGLILLSWISAVVAETNRRLGR